MEIFFFSLISVLCYPTPHLIMNVTPPPVSVLFSQSIVIVSNLELP